MIKFFPNKKTNTIALLLLAGVVFGICVLTMRLSEMVSLPTQYVLSSPTPQRMRNLGIVEGSLCGLDTVICPNEKIKVTAFSSGECHTDWCKKNPELVGHQIALNSKFGKAKKVYIPAYQKMYDVIGTTDYKTDADIYFGSDYEGAKQYGVKYLEINIIN